jgi:hypothetical protein
MILCLESHCDSSSLSFIEASHFDRIGHIHHRLLQCGAVCQAYRSTSNGVLYLRNMLIYLISKDVKSYGSCLKGLLAVEALESGPP